MLLPVTGAVRAGVVHTDDDEDVLEVGADVLRGERQSSRLLKDDGDYVVPYVPLPQELKDRKHGQPLSWQSIRDEVTVTQHQVTALYVICLANSWFYLCLCAGSTSCVCVCVGDIACSPGRLCHLPILSSDAKRKCESINYVIQPSVLPQSHPPVWCHGSILQSHLEDVNMTEPLKCLQTLSSSPVNTHSFTVSVCVPCYIEAFALSLLQSLLVGGMHYNE